MVMLQCLCVSISVNLFALVEGFFFSDKGRGRVERERERDQGNRQWAEMTVHSLVDCQHDSDSECLTVTCTGLQVWLQGTMKIFGSKLQHSPWHRSNWESQDKNNSKATESILLANVQSLENKVDMLCFTEAWLAPDILSPSIQPAGFSVHCADRNKELSGKKKGWGVCFMINCPWCDCDNVQKLKTFCSCGLEYLRIKCRPYYLPR